MLRKVIYFCNLFTCTFAAALLLSNSTGSTGAAAQTIGVDHEQEYSACMTLTRIKPDDAFESALAWSSQGGGEAARHCAAVALIALGHYEEAGRRLESLAQDMIAAKPSLRADIFGQAGQAWFLAGNTERAYAVQTAAIDLDPSNVELLIDRSVTLATAANYWDAIDDLNRAAELAPQRADLLIFRASAYRFVDAADLARDDVERALAISPQNPEGLLERGILRRLAGDIAGAREDWVNTATLAGGTPTGDAAQKNLEMLDVKVE